MNENHSKQELALMLAAMRAASEAFYFRAIHIGNHAFIEFTGLMNEYIKLCEEAHAQGVDFTTTNIHGGGAALPMKGYHRAYISEKLECIYGVSLDALMKRKKEG